MLENYQNPSFIWNLDKTPFFYNMIPYKTIARRGGKSIVIRTSIQEKIKISVLFTIVGDGIKLTPLIIFKGKKKEELPKK